LYQFDKVYDSRYWADAGALGRISIQRPKKAPKRLLSIDRWFYK
jgi:hypothetical protein